MEPYKRGLYTGSIGYIGFDGAWDTNIVIRTVVLKDGQAYFNGGGGIVADSVPEAEYQESLQKILMGMERTLIHLFIFRTIVFLLSRKSFDFR